MTATETILHYRRLAFTARAERDAVAQDLARLAARLAAVEALADPDYPPPPPDERGAAGWRFAMDHVRAALETDTTKEN